MQPVDYMVYTWHFIRKDEQIIYLIDLELNMNNIEGLQMAFFVSIRCKNCQIQQKIDISDGTMKGRFIEWKIWTTIQMERNRRDWFQSYFPANRYSTENVAIITLPVMKSY